MPGPLVWAFPEAPTRATSEEQAPHRQGDKEKTAIRTPSQPPMARTTLLGVALIFLLFFLFLLLGGHLIGPDGGYDVVLNAISMRQAREAHTYCLSKQLDAHTNGLHLSTGGSTGATNNEGGVLADETAGGRDERHRDLACD